MDLNFYPRPPRGGRHYQLKAAGGYRIFLSTPSARRATSREAGGEEDTVISIHALREEGDGIAR